MSKKNKQVMHSLLILYSSYSILKFTPIKISHMSQKSPNSPKHAIRPLYEEHGAQAYYQQFGADYHNPHEAIITQCLHDALGRWQLDTTQVLDLACGSGEVTLALRTSGVQAITGIDPFTGEAYQQRTGQEALAISFEDIASGAISTHRYSLIVCSFALHLAELSRLPLVCYQLSVIAPQLLILTPHKRPQIDSTWGWQLVNESKIERVRTRLYHSLNSDQP
jgi:2-polyprenyl-3-methyl-5-hydroxy-6-metoxy-1,4-benzoquinol methylase